MPKEGQVWPLHLVFVLLLVLAVLSISAPTVFSDKALIGSGLTQALLWIGSLAIAILLYIPAVRDWLAVRSLITNQTETVVRRSAAIETRLAALDTRLDTGVKALSDQIAKIPRAGP